MSDAFRDVETPLPSPAPPERHTSEYASRPVPDTLQSFLSQVGVVTAPMTSSTSELGGLGADNNTANQVVSVSLNSHDESIFESQCDLSLERLRYVFSRFDTDEDGRISYDSLKNGLKFYVGGLEETASLLDDSSFQYLIRHLDMDSSGDVSFEEFSEGLRLLILRSLFRVQATTDNATAATVQVTDYDSVSIDIRMVSSSTPLDNENNDYINDQEFYFRSRPEWVKTRWINVAPNGSRVSAATTMNRLAIKYSLHPLALEDALSPEVHRPKAELYSNHYFIMAPVFYIEWENVQSEAKVASNGLSRLLPCALFRRRNESTEKITAETVSSGRKTRVARINSQMVSIFVTVPENSTIITFTSGVAKESRDVALLTDDVNDSSQCLWKRVQGELEKSYSKLRQYDAQYLTYALLDEAVDLIEPIMRSMRKEIEHERGVLSKGNYRDLSRTRHLKEQLERVGRKFKPFLRLLTHVIEDDAISPGATVYLRDVLDNLECSDEELRQLISDCEGLEKEADKMLSRQMDLTLYTLTVVSAVFLPAQFLTGVWGMNFTHMPELDKKWGYQMFWGISSAMFITMILLLNCGRLR